jgi:hypothetical protein
MKLQLQGTPERVEFLNDEGLCVIVQGKTVSVDDSLDAEEIFELGEKFGSERTKAFWTKPDELHLPNEYAKLFIEAINEYAEASRTEMTSITWKERENYTCFFVAPTHIHHLFNVIAR